MCAPGKTGKRKQEAGGGSQRGGWGQPGFLRARQGRAAAASRAQGPWERHLNLSSPGARGPAANRMARREPGCCLQTPRHRHGHTEHRACSGDSPSGAGLVTGGTARAPRAPSLPTPLRRGPRRRSEFSQRGHGRAGAVLGSPLPAPAPCSAALKQQLLDSEHPAALKQEQHPGG